MTFTDLVLPGDAGMDLRVQRTFNKQTGVWRFGLSGVPMEVIEPEPPWNQQNGPKLLMADAAIHRMTPVNGIQSTDVG